MYPCRLRQAVLHPDLIKAQKSNDDDEVILGSDEDESVVSSPKPSTSLQDLKRGVSWSATYSAFRIVADELCQGCPVCFEAVNSPVVVQECGHAG
jgi:hypothetical protein